MRLNKKGTLYIEPNPPQKCRVTDASGLIYKATSAPAGFCRCGLMLELKPGKTDYIFPTTKSARHAISHTIVYLESIGVTMRSKDFFVEKVD